MWIWSDTLSMLSHRMSSTTAQDAIHLQMSNQVILWRLFRQLSWGAIQFFRKWMVKILYVEEHRHPFHFPVLVTWVCRGDGYPLVLGIFCLTSYALTHHSVLHLVWLYFYQALTCIRVCQYLIKMLLKTAFFHLFTEADYIVFELKVHSCENCYIHNSHPSNKKELS